MTGSENRSKQNYRPKSNAISPHGFEIPLPNTTAVISQNSLSGLRTDEQFQGFIDDLAFRLETRELSCLAHQTLINVDIGSHGLIIHHSRVFLCIAYRLTSNHQGFEAGRRFARYAKRRRRSAHQGPKRLLADFVIGSHALAQADRFMRLDPKRYQRDSPELN